MKKTELVNAVAAAASLSKADTERALDAFVAVTHTALAEGKRVALPDLGAFTTKERAARNGRNPRTGESIDIAAKTVVGFKVAKALAEHVA